QPSGKLGAPRACSALACSSTTGPIVVGDGGCNPTITFPTSGQWNVTLKATNSEGVSATASIVVNVQDPPTAATANISLPLDNASFRTLEVTPLRGWATVAPLVSYEWSFVD